MENKTHRILHVSPSYFPAHSFGGPIQSVHLLNSEISKCTNLEIYTTNAGLAKDQNITPNSKTLINTIPITYFSFWGYQHFNFSIPILIALFKNVRNFDLIHITAVWNFPVLAATLACRYYKKPYIISPRGTIYPETMAMGSVSFKSWYLKYLALPFLKKAKAIHYTAEDEMQKVQQYLGLNNGFVIANGVEAIKIKKSEISFPSFIPNCTYLLFLGRIDAKKGLDLLINAFADLSQKYTQLQLVVAGPDSNGYLQTMQNLVNQLGLQQKVIFTGQVLGLSKTQLYTHAKAFVLSSYSENFGMAVVEAMICGCPVVISDQVGIYKDILQYKAGIVTKTTVESVKKGIIEILDNTDNNKTYIENATRLVSEKYEISKVAADFLKLYQTIISNNK